LNFHRKQEKSFICSKHCLILWNNVFIKTELLTESILHTKAMNLKSIKFVGQTTKKRRNEKGFSLVEILIVLIIVSILAVIALPQIMASRRAMRFAGLQRQVSATLRDARQQAVSQRTPITVRYDDVNKRMIVYGGNFGLIGTQNNLINYFANEGIVLNEIVYGKPAGAPATALGDGSNIETLVGGKVEITFQADGAVVDTSNNPQNKAIFFYDTKAAGLAFAVSVLGAGGRVKIWRYSTGTNSYVE
jgi:prepilin-type N-terminal cleavage/methylation domain-containing protein